MITTVSCSFRWSAVLSAMLCTRTTPGAASGGELKSAFSILLSLPPRIAVCSRTGMPTAADPPANRNSGTVYVQVFSNQYRHQAAKQQIATRYVCCTHPTAPFIIAFHIMIKRKGRRRPTGRGGNSLLTFGHVLSVREETFPWPASAKRQLPRAHACCGVPSVRPGRLLWPCLAQI